MKVLVTGSAGLVGNNMVQALAAEGCEIRTLDLKAKPRAAAWEHLPGDLRNISFVRQAVDGIDTIVHMGAISWDSMGTPEDILSVNVQGTWNLLLAAAEAGISRMVYFSSVHALGNFSGHRQSDFLPIDDSYPPHPISAYQLSKHLAEEACQSFTARYGIATICLRPVYIAVPEHYRRWQHHSAEERARYNRKDYWAYVDVRDVCRAAVIALTIPSIQFGAYLLSADDTLIDIPTVELIDKYFSETPWTQGDREAYFAENPYRSLVDCSLAKEQLGWAPEHSWRETAETLMAEAT